jgi:hypothetical protein
MPFTPARIKYLLIENTNKPTLTAIAEAWQVRFEELSMCVRQVAGRIYPELRIKISQAIGYPVVEVFGEHPLTTALLSNQETNERSAA